MHRKKLVGSRRYIIDSTNVEADARGPFPKMLIREAFTKAMKELGKADHFLAENELELFEAEIQSEYDGITKVEASRHFEIAKRRLENLYPLTYDVLDSSPKYMEAYKLCIKIIRQNLNNEKDKIASVVDTDARAAHKTPGNVKFGYKDHIIVDEDSEIILASSQTPFNVGDEKKFEELIGKVSDNYGLKPKQVTADKVYGTIGNRAYLKDKKIISNIAFCREREKENKVFGIKDFNIAQNLSSVTCPNGRRTKMSKKIQIADDKFLLFSFTSKDCRKCPLKDKCLMKNKRGNYIPTFRKLRVPERYDAVLHDQKRQLSEDFRDALSMRFKIERSFATMVRNHGLRRCRYTGMTRSSIHIKMANMASNIIRMIALLYASPDKFAARV